MSTPTTPMSTIPLILLLGASGVGKSTFAAGTFDPAYRPTTYGYKVATVTDHTVALMELGGTQRYTPGYDQPLAQCTTLCSKSPAGVLIFYDVTSTVSRREAEYYAGRVAAEDQHIPVCFVGNKCDIRTSDPAAVRLPKARPGSTTLHCMISLKTGAGMETLRLVLEAMLTPEEELARREDVGETV